MTPEKFSATRTMATTAMKINIPPPDEEEQLLAKFVFGDTTDLQENLAKFNADFIFNEQEMDIEDQEDEGATRTTVMMMRRRRAT